MTTTINPYLTFEGNCREAMEFYNSVFGGQLEIMPFEGSPVDVPDEHKNKVMHAGLRFEDATLMASDTMPGGSVEQGTNYSISIAAQTVEEGEKYFTQLSQGGEVKMPFSKQFWGAQFGMLTDRYGINWMINVNLES